MNSLLRSLLAIPFCMFIWPDLSDSQTIYTLQTKDLKLLYYSKAHSYIVPHVARCFQNALKFHRNLFQYDSDEGIAVLLQDFQDFGNGAAGIAPKNLVSIGLAPVSTVFETLPGNERMNWVMNHELVHIVTLDKASSSDRFYRSLFLGKVYPIADNPLSMIYAYLTSPRQYSTRWYREGIAAFIETWMAGGLGRALGSYDEMVFRSMVRDDSYFYDWVGLESEGTKVDFQVGANAYLYGTRFMTFLSHKFGPEKLIQWTTRTNDSRSHFAAQFASTYGVSLDQEWDYWINFEHEWQRTNLDSIRLNPVTLYRPLTTETLGSVSHAAFDSAKRVVIAAINYPGQVPHVALIHIDNGSIEELCDVKGAALYDVAALTYDQSRGMIFFTTDNNGWRDLNSVDINTGEPRLLIKNCRIGDLVFNKQDKSLWGVRHENGYSTIVRIPHPYTDWNTIYTCDYGKDVVDIDLSPDGSVFTCGQADVNGKQFLIRLDVEKLKKGRFMPDTLYDFEFSNPANFVFSPDGKYLFGTSYFTGVSNVFRYDFQGKKMEVLSNCETGFFRPVPYSADSLIIFRYSGKGFLPAIIAIQPTENVSAIRFLGNELVEKYPLVKNWIVPSPALINIDSLTTYSGEYFPFSNIGIGSAYPITEGYKNYAAFGVRFNLADRILLHSMDFTVSYTPNQFLQEQERFHAALDYKFWEWTMRATYNAADFYDLFGPTKTSRKGYSLALQYKNTFVHNDPELADYSLRAGGYGGLERLPDFQNVSSSFDKLFSFTARIHYEYLQKSLGSTDKEKGVRLELRAHDNYVNGRNVPLLNVNLDYGFQLAFGHSSVWLRSSFGQSFGDRNDPFGNFYFGGFGNNWVDHAEIKRFREYYTFPGTELNSIDGFNYGKMMVEWMLPPIRFRRFGFAYFYCSWAQISLFGSSILTNYDFKQTQRNPANAGAQVDFKLALFSSLDATFSLGYAAAFEESRLPTNEFMFSLKILQ